MGWKWMKMSAVQHASLMPFLVVWVMCFTWVAMSYPWLNWSCRSDLEQLLWQGLSKNLKKVLLAKVIKCKIFIRIWGGEHNIGTNQKNAKTKREKGGLDNPVEFQIPTALLHPSQSALRPIYHLWRSKLLIELIKPTKFYHHHYQSSPLG